MTWRSAAVPKETAGNDTFLWSLADLMTLLLIFFVMLYADSIEHAPAVTIATSGQTPVEQPTVADDEWGVFPEGASRMAITPSEGVDAQPRPNDPPAVQTPAPELDASVENANRRIVADLEDSFSKDFYVRWEDRQPVLVLGERISFNAGEALLLKNARRTLKRVARMISHWGDCRVVVAGHTDDLPISTPAFPSNWELSAARAASVAKVLMAHGVAPQQMIIQGQSEFKPLLANTSEENRRANRRVEISLITDQSP